MSYKICTIGMYSNKPNPLFDSCVYHWISTYTEGHLISEGKVVHDLILSYVRDAL
jgi:hypothetical protein